MTRQIGFSEKALQVLGRYISEKPTSRELTWRNGGIVGVVAPTNKVARQSATVRVISIVYVVFPSHDLCQYVHIVCPYALATALSAS